MKKNLFRSQALAFMLLPLLFGSFACSPSEPPRTSALRFAVISDVHLDAFQEPSSAVAAASAKAQRRKIPRDVRKRFRKVLKELKKQKVDFVVITGDNLNFLDEANVRALKEEVQRSGLEVHWVPGNRDHLLLSPGGQRLGTKEGPSDPWKDCEPYWRILGGRPLSKPFIKEGRCFIFLDDSDGRFDEQEIKAASDFLDRHPHSRVFVFFHKPLRMPNETLVVKKRLGPIYGVPSVLKKEDITEPSPIFDFLKRYQDRMEGIFAGHVHGRAEDRWGKDGFPQVTLQASYVHGMYARVDCEKKGECRSEIRTAW